MNVLLISSIPDPREHPMWATTADNVAIREAVRALATAVAANLGTLFVPPNEAIVALVRAIVPVGRWMVADDPGLFAEQGVRLRSAVLIGGMDAELAAARAMRAAGVRVFPVGTTGAAAGVAVGEAMLDERWGLSTVDCALLKVDTVYGALFDKILSL